MCRRLLTHPENTGYQTTDFVRQSREPSVQLGSSSWSPPRFLTIELTRIVAVFNQRELAELFINSQLLRGIRDESDVRDMPAEKRQLALRAMRNAQNSMRICLGGKGVGPRRLRDHGPWR